MPYFVRFDPNSINQQGAVITDATETEVGVVTLAKIKSLVKAGGLFVFGNRSVGSTTITRRMTAGFNQVIAPTATIGAIVPQDGVLKNLYVRHNRSVGNGNPVVYTVRINGVPTPITVSLPTGAIGTGSDLTNSVPVVAGDQIDIEVTKAAGILNGRLNVVATVEVA